jgi:hypothetical protein
MMRTTDGIRLGVLLGIVLGTAACPAADRPVNIGMSDSTFVRTIVRLRRVGEDTALDSLAKDSVRQVVLRQQKVTVEQLDAAAKALAAQPRRADTLWQTIENQVARRQPGTPQKP